MNNRGERFYHYLNELCPKIPEGWTMHICISNEALWFHAEDQDDELEVCNYPDVTVEESMNELLDNILELEKKRAS